MKKSQVRNQARRTTTYTLYSTLSVHGAYTVKDGECITVTSNGVPVAELVPLRRGRFVDAQAALEAFADAPSIDLKTLRDDLDVIGDPDFLPRG